MIFAPRMPDQSPAGRCVNPLRDPLYRRRLDAEIAVRRHRLARPALDRDALREDDLLERGVGERGGDLRRVAGWVRRADIANVGDVSGGTTTSPDSLSNKVSPELLRPVTEEVTMNPATLSPSRAPPPTAAVEP